VVSRILWLDGLEDHNANTRERFIYIHGTKHEDKIGNPASHGCIRMRNADVIDLFDLVDEDTPVVIRE
jgi:lipoprotein-anchoring transpeptidase ErfK/SrfK